MRQVYIVSFATLLPMLLLGCGAQQSETSSSNPAPVPSQAAQSQVPSIPTTSVTTVKTTKVAQGSIGLIPSTNPEVRRKSVATGGRNNPFSSLAVQPQIEISSVATGAPDSTSVIGTARTSSTSTLGPRFTGIKTASPSQPASVRSGSKSVTAYVPGTASRNPGAVISSKGTTGKSGHPLVKPSVPYVPPSTDLAKAVEVTGVVQTGQTLVAIVHDPQEPTSRNVQAGERLSNGQVLVKRISVGIAGSPVIVLEQNGVEVIKTLGSSSALTS